MDFLEKHIEITNNEKERIERFAKDVLLEQHKKYTESDSAFIKLKKRLCNEFGTKNLISKYSIHFGGIHNSFVSEVKKIRNDCPDKIKAVLENEIYEKFNNLHHEKYPNSEYDEDFENINYEIFVNELLKFDAYQNLSFNIDLIKDEIEKKYNSKKIEKIEFFKLIDKNSISDNNTKKQISKIYTDIIENKLSDKEQAFLFYIMCDILSESKDKNNDFKIPATEIVRLQMLINLYDENVFIGRHGDTLLYQFLTKGFNNIEDVEIKLFINRLIQKISKLQLSKTVIKINEYYTIYQNSKNKPKK